MDCEIALAGAGARERAEVMARALRLRLGDWADADISIDLVGAGSVLRAGSQLLRGAIPELRVHVSARCSDGEQAQTIEDEVYAMTLSGPAGASRCLTASLSTHGCPPRSSGVNHEGRRYCSRPRR
jgi:hypothetical protein